jgi:hypothetical protein
VDAFEERDDSVDINVPEVAVAADWTVLAAIAAALAAIFVLWRRPRRAPRGSA